MRRSATAAREMFTFWAPVALILAAGFLLAYRRFATVCYGFRLPVRSQLLSGDRVYSNDRRTSP